ncbi:MAG TPA: glycosyltransferase, partial [Bacteroidota bacterium]
QADLSAAYNAASVAVSTSRYEGFGLPPLEAMACGTACVVSDAGALPEVVGDAAVICRAGQAAEFADAMEAILTKADVREALIRRGTENVRRFSWKTTARKTLEIYDSLS